MLKLLKDSTTPEDLLVANPNHGMIPDDESEDDEFHQHKPLGSDSE